EDLAVLVGGVRATDQVGPRNAEGAIWTWTTIEHEAVKVGVCCVAAEFAEFAATRPGVGADLGTFEGTSRMRWKCHPETDLVRSEDLAVLVGGVRATDQVGPRNAEGAIWTWTTIEHEAVKVGVCCVAAEFAEFAATRPGVGADLGTFEGTSRMRWKCHPETDLV